MNFVGIVDRSVQDCVEQCRIFRGLTLFVQWGLTGDNGRLQGIAIIHEFHHITLLCATNLMQVQSSGRNTLMCASCFNIWGTAGGFTRELERFWKAMQAAIADSEVFQTDFVGQRASHIAFTDSSGAGNQDILPPTSLLN